MRSKHTPGPWAAEEFAIYGPSDRPFRTIQEVAHVGGTGRSIEEQRANAKLIAAAPDLLAALRTVVETFGPWHEENCPADDTCNCASKPIHDAVNTAIQKACGLA